jgi:hypothetical protein
MSLSMISNYGAKEANNTASVKEFFFGFPEQLWRTITLPTNGNVLVIAPNPNYMNLYIPGTIYVGNSVVTVSDKNMKTNIEEIEEQACNNILNLEAKKYKYLNEDDTQIHYGFIAQDVEKYYPNLVVNGVNEEAEQIKSVNYLEMIPLLVSKMQKMQNEIDKMQNEMELLKKQLEQK